MTHALDRRLARLEARDAPPLRQRCVWLDEGDPMPEAEPGEQLVVVRWRWDSDDEPAEPARRASVVAAACRG
jgi:hypothetical protein